MYFVQVMHALMREVRDVLYGKTPTHARLRDTLVGIAVATAGIDLICAVLALALEHGVPQTQVTNFGDAIFWTTTQLLTVSSQIRNPISVGGRILDVFMEAYAITVVATLAGSIGAYLIRRGRQMEQLASHEARGTESPR